VEVSFHTIQRAECQGAFDASLKNRVVVTSSPASLADAPRRKHGVVGANAFQVMEGLNDGNTVSSENRKNGRRNLMADIVQVGDIRPLSPQQRVHLSCGVPGVQKPQAEANSVAKGNIGAIVVNLLHEERRLWGSLVSPVLGGEDHDGVPFLLEKRLQPEEVGFRSPERKVELIDE
jgi:hypothetical protein